MIMIILNIVLVKACMDDVLSYVREWGISKLQQSILLSEYTS